MLLDKLWTKARTTESLTSKLTPSLRAATMLCYNLYTMMASIILDVWLTSHCPAASCVLFTTRGRTERTPVAAAATTGIAAGRQSGVSLTSATQLTQVDERLVRLEAEGFTTPFQTSWLGMGNGISALCWLASNFRTSGGQSFAGARTKTAGADITAGTFLLSEATTARCARPQGRGRVSYEQLQDFVTDRPKAASQMKNITYGPSISTLFTWSTSSGCQP